MRYCAGPVQYSWICTVQIQLRKHALGYADGTAPTRQHELDPADQESICPERTRSSSRNRFIRPMYDVLSCFSRREFDQLPRTIIPPISVLAALKQLDPSTPESVQFN